MGNELRDQTAVPTMVQPRSKIADTITAAIAESTGLKPEQITGITAGPEQILITYTGSAPGLIGGYGRQAVRTYDTKTGDLLSDLLVDDPAERARVRANVDSRRRSLFAQNPDIA